MGFSLSVWPLSWVFLLVFVAYLAFFLSIHWYLRHGHHRWDKARQYTSTWLTQPVLFLFAYLLTPQTVHGITGNEQLSPYLRDPISMLAILAIGFAITQFWDARVQSKRIEQVVQSSSTRYIGVFPKNLEDIIQVVSTADRELLILADSVCYGHYSNPEAYKRFCHELIEARDRGVSVRFLVYVEEVQAQALCQQFPREKFDQVLASTRFHAYFEAFPGKHKPVNHTEFVDMLREVHHGAEKQLSDKGVRIQHLSKEERFFFWLEDDEDAVFTFENVTAGGGQREGLCFRTRDAKLIETFRSVLEAHWKPERGEERIRLEVVPKTG